MDITTIIGIIIGLILVTGALFAYLFLNPLAGKLGARSAEEVLRKELIVESHRCDLRCEQGSKSPGRDHRSLPNAEYSRTKLMIELRR